MKGQRRVFQAEQRLQLRSKLLSQRRPDNLGRHVALIDQELADAS